MIKSALFGLGLFALALGQVKNGVKTQIYDPTPIKLLQIPPEGNLTFVISAKDLPSSDPNTKVDPFVKVYSQSGNQSEGDKTELVKLGTTDTLKNQDSPVWNNVFWFKWTRGNNQKLHFLVRDHDVLNVDDSIGDAIIDLDEFVGNGQVSTAPLSNGGTLTVRGTTPIYFRLFARNLPKKDSSTVLKGLSDPYVECYFRTGRDGEDIKFYETKKIDNEEHPNWRERIEFDHYQKGRDMYLHFRVLDHDSLTSNDELGEAYLALDSFVERKALTSIALEGHGAEMTHATISIIPSN